MQGLVIRNTGSWYTVECADGKTWECKVKGNFRLKGIRSTNPVAIGDNVAFEPLDESTGLINCIEDRKNYVIRKSTNLSKQSHIIAANVDQCFLFVTLRQNLVRRGHGTHLQKLRFLGGDPSLFPEAAFLRPKRRFRAFKHPHHRGTRLRADIQL
jgi:putative ribosome biogenesis GTPase RsgA